MELSLGLEATAPLIAIFIATRLPFVTRWAIMQEGLPKLETVLGRVHPDDREIVNVEIDEASRQKRNFGLEFRIALPDGTAKKYPIDRPPFVLRGW